MIDGGWALDDRWSMEGCRPSSLPGGPPDAWCAGVATTEREGSVCACIMRGGAMWEGGGGRRSGVDQHHRHSAADGMADGEQEGAVCVLMGQRGACFDVNRGSRGQARPHPKDAECGETSKIGRDKNRPIL